MLLIIVGTFTINSSFGQYSNLDWNQICNTVEFALYNSCDVYVNNYGQLTTEGERAFGCIRNGLLLGGAATGLSVPLEIIIPGLDFLSGMTGCDGVVKLDLLSQIGNPNQLLNTLTQMLSGNRFTNTLPQSNFNQNTLSENDISENTSPSAEYLLYSNELFSVYYPSDWVYEVSPFLGEPNVVFHDKYNFMEVVQIATYKSKGTTIDDLISNITNQQLSLNFPNSSEFQILDIKTENIYLGNYPAFKATTKVNSEDIPFQKVTSYTTIANDKQYAIMLLSNPYKISETNQIFERMASSFEIFPVETTDSKTSFENNEEQYSWDSRISDGIITYKVNSSDLKFRNQVDSAFNEWEEKLSPLIVFEKIKYGNADITFIQVQNLPIDKLDNNKVKIDNGTTILSSSSNSSLIDNININILQDIDVNDELVIKHQIGHALGLKHSDNENSIMYPSSANYTSQEITLCDAYRVHIINFGENSNSPIDENVCNDSIENNQKDFTDTVPSYKDKYTETIIEKLFTPVSVNAPVQGDEQAKITIVEFADYQCPSCAKFHKETKDSIIQNFVETGKVKFLFKDLIVNDKTSTLAAAASYCAAEQGKYWEYNDELYKNSQDKNTDWITKDNLKQFANNIKLPSILKFSDCVESDKYNTIVTENDSLGKNIGLTATPTFIFYNETTPVAIQGAQPYELFEQIINEMS